MNLPVANFSLPVPSPDDRSNPLLMHILAIFSGFLAPLLFFIRKRDSLFVKFHSPQALIWYAAYMVVFVVEMLFTFSTMFFTLAQHPHPAPGDAPPLPCSAFLVLFGCGEWAAGW
jgi:uncharacterized Tic20 family protein